MTAWAWPQFLIAILLVVGFVFGFVKNLRDRDITSDIAMLNILGWAAYEAAYAGVLHAGGFW
jgi:vacuolar-type H+-ATPase subunit I/STV1